MTNNHTIPTEEVFKEEAKTLLKTTPGIKDHSQALDVLARDKYKQKNYATIKPLLKKSVFPISESALSEHMDRHLLELGKNYSGNLEYFLNKSFDFYKVLSKIYFKNKKHHPFIRNKKELMDFQLLLHGWRVYPLLKREMANNASSPDTEELFLMLSWVDTRIDDILKNEIDDAFNWLSTSPEVLRRHDIGMQQLSYFTQASNFFFLSLSMEAMDKDYYDVLRKGSVAQENKNRVTVDHFIKDLELVIKTAWLHDTEKAFIDDLVRNRPIEQRAYSYELLKEDTLSIIFRNKTSFFEPMERLRAGGTMKDIDTFLNYLADLETELAAEDLEQFVSSQES